MQGVAAKNDASYDLSRARASVTGQTTIAASTATTSLPNGERWSDRLSQVRRLSWVHYCGGSLPRVLAS